MNDKNILTVRQFARKSGVSVPTLYRWLKDKEQVKRLKMYDAKPVKVAGKVFIGVETKTK